MNRLSLVPLLVSGLVVVQGCAESENGNLGAGASSGNAGAAANGGDAGAQNGGTGGSLAGNGGEGGTTAQTGGASAGGSGPAGGSSGSAAGGAAAGGAATGGAATGGAATGGAAAGGAATGGAATGGAATGGAATGGAATGGAGGTLGGSGGVATGGAGGTTGGTGGTGGMSGNCTQITATPIYVLDAAGPYVYFSTAPSIGGPEQDFLFYEFYANTTGTFDLTSAGENDNYETCTQCLRALQDVTPSAPATSFFQTSGSVTISGAPSSGTPQITLQNVTLSQVTINTTTFHSTLVPGGTCYTIATPTTSTAIGTTPEGSCVGFCGYTGGGAFPAENCYCDSTCLGAGDCCSDYTSVCP